MTRDMIELAIQDAPNISGMLDCMPRRPRLDTRLRSRSSLAPLARIRYNIEAEKASIAPPSIPRPEPVLVDEQSLEQPAEPLEIEVDRGRLLGVMDTMSPPLEKIIQGSKNA